MVSELEQPPLFEQVYVYVFPAITLLALNTPRLGVIIPGPDQVVPTGNGGFTTIIVGCVEQTVAVALLNTFG